MELSILENNIKYRFKNIKLLEEALTHTSYAHERKIESNEKLEFLGDAILELVISEYLYRNYPKLREGDMTKVRAAVVCETSLYNIALKYEFNNFLLLGKGEMASQGNQKPAILADSVEAVIAAMFLDSDMENVREFIINNLKEAVDVSSKNVGMKDYKTVLQEELQKHGNVKIEYKITKEMGPDHDKTFVVEINCNGEYLATGEGNSKKHAEMEAARKALEKHFA